jgi:spermidine synthase
MYVTLKKVFPQVAVIPGDSNIFLASDSALATDSESLVRRIQELALETSYVSPGMLAARLNPLRVRALEEKIESGSGYLNTDLAPVSYFFNSVLWSTQFKSLEAKFLTFLTRIPVSRLLDIPLTIFVGFLLLLRFRRKSRGYSLLPFILMGMTTMAVEIMVLIWFQSSYGYVYKQVALLLTTFMAGLALGALRGITRKAYRYAQILLLQFCFLILVLLIKISLNARPPEIIPFAFLFLLGFFGGDFFIVSNKVFFKDVDQAGLGYGLDLLGSFAAAVGLSSILIPLAGLPLLFQYLFLLNSFGLLFLAMKPRAIFS